MRVGVAGPYESKAGGNPVNSVRELEGKTGMTVAKVIEFYIPNNFRKNGFLPNDVGRLSNSLHR